MKRILVIENEYSSIKQAFEIANSLFFNKELEFTNVDKSQYIKFMELHLYDVIFVDISLAQKSELDGWGIIKKIQSIDAQILEKVVILTGNNKIEEALKDKELSIETLIKPIGFHEVHNVINKILCR